MAAPTGLPGLSQGDRTGNAHSATQSRAAEKSKTGDGRAAESQIPR